MSTSRHFDDLGFVGILFFLLPAAMLFSANSFAQELESSDTQQVFYTLPISELEITEGELPTTEERSVYQARAWRRFQVTRPYAKLDGPGESYLQLASQRGYPPNNVAYRQATLAVRVPAGNDPITGQLFLPNADWNGMFSLKFKIPQEGKRSGRQAFLREKLTHYEELLQLGVPGTAWFRHQTNLTRKALGKAPQQTPRTNRPRVVAAGADWEFQRSFAMLSGGRALSENLQLDRLLPVTAPAKEMVSIDTIGGITVRPFDWTSMVQDLDPEVDPLAHLIPNDQHALFFSTYQALADLSDHATIQATPILRMMEPRGEDAMTQLRYETQLGLSLSTFARALGPQVIDSVVLTGADPYLRTGADVALLFEPKNRQALEKLLQGKLALASHGHPEVEEVRGEVDGIEYTGRRSPDRTICSYQATLGDAVVVTNSLAQLGRLVEVFLGKHPSLASLPEYTFFRDRYR